MTKITFSFQENTSIFWEDIKTLRTNILFSGVEKRVLLMASCMSGEGKSTVACELARSFTKMNKSALLIDADLRKGRISKGYNYSNEVPGLTHYLSGQCALEDIICATNAANLYVIPGGLIPSNPTDLLGSANMKKLVDSARQAFDYIIIDCAPLCTAIDGAVVATYCDGALMLIEANRVPRRMGIGVKEQLNKSGCPVLGVILNKVDAPKGKYYYYYE